MEQQNESARMQFLRSLVRLFLDEGDNPADIEAAVRRELVSSDEPQPSLSAPQPSLSAPQPSLSAPQPSLSVPQPSSSPLQPSRGAPQPSRGTPFDQYLSALYNTMIKEHGLPQGGKSTQLCLSLLLRWFNQFTAAQGKALSATPLREHLEAAPYIRISAGPGERACFLDLAALRRALGARYSKSAKLALAEPR